MNISGIYPTYYAKYNGSIPFEQRVDTVIEWLKKPDGERPSFITLYHDQPDHTAHTYGPETTQVNHIVIRLQGTEML